MIYPCRTVFCLSERILYFMKWEEWQFMEEAFPVAPSCQKLLRLLTSSPHESKHAREKITMIHIQGCLEEDSYEATNDLQG